MNFIGEKCAACGEIFTAEDDVVVCPDCGSPHHRDCYKKAGKCANEKYHFEKKKWERELNKDKVFVVCPVCHFPNNKDDDVCERCGSALNEEPDKDNTEMPYESFSGMFDEEMGQPRPYLGFDPDEDLGGATVKEVSEFVQTNTIYYLPVFKRMKDIGSKISLNVICLLFPSLYFANRKMWGWAVLTVIFSVLLNTPAAFIYMADIEEVPQQIVSVIEAHEQMLNNANYICMLLEFGMKLLFCLLGNSMYFNYIVRSLRKIRESGGAYMAQKVAEMGGIKPANMVLITIIKGAVALGILFIALYVYDLTGFLNALDSTAVIGGILG